LASRVSGKGQGRRQSAGKKVRVKIDYDLEREYVWVYVRFEGNFTDAEKKRVANDLSRLFEEEHGLETWEEMTWEGDGVEISTVRKIKEKLESRGYYVQLDVD